MHSIAYQRVLVSRVMQRSVPIRTDSAVVSKVLDNYKRSIVIDKHTLVGLDEVEENFRKDLLMECAYVNGPELEDIAKDLDKAKICDRLSQFTMCVTMSSIVSMVVFDAIIAFFFIAPPSAICGYVFAVRSDLLRNRVERKVELLRGLERRIVDVPNTEEMLELLTNSARE